MGTFIGAIASSGNTKSKYYNRDFENKVANPSKGAALDDLGYECIPVGIQDTYMPLDKGDVHSADTPNLTRAQYNIRERFGYLSEDD